MKTNYNLKLFWITTAPLDVGMFSITRTRVMDSLRKLGWQVTILGTSMSKMESISKNQLFARRPFKNGYLNRIYQYFDYFRKIHAHIYKEAPDVILIESPLVFCAGILPLLSKYRIGCNSKWIMDVRTLLIPDGPWYKRTFDKVLETIGACYASKIFSGFTFITEGTKKIMESLTGSYMIPYKIRPSGVDPEIFNPSLFSNEICLKRRAEMGIGPDEFVFCYHGSITMRRGISELLEGFALENLPNTRLLILGAGEMEQTQQIIERLGLGSKVILREAVSNSRVPEFLALSDAGVCPLPDLPYWTVSSPIKILECMSMALPIVVSNIEAHKNILHDLGGVFWISEFSPKGVGQALRQCFSQGHKKVLALRKRIEEWYSFVTHATVLDKFFRELLAGRK